MTESSNIYILVIEDEPDVLDALVRDLESFEDMFPVEMAEDAEEAEQLIESICEDGHEVGLALCDHVLPGKNGVDLLIEMTKWENTKQTRKVLVTGQAGLEDTVKAVNEAGLHHYIAKPWDKEQLEAVVKKQLTEYVLRTRKDLLSFMSKLDQERLADAIHDRGSISDS